MVKRKIFSETEKIVRTKPASKTIEREFASALKKMIDEMNERFNNQVFKKLNKGTISKFEDAQVGNFAKIFLTLANRAKKKLLRQFSNSRVEGMIDNIYGRIDTYNKETFYAQVEKEIGISAKELLATEGLKPNINALILETQQWVKKLRDDTLEFFTNTTLRGMAEGKSLDQIKKEFGELTDKRKSNAEMVARTQVNTFNSLNNKIRAQNLGITEGIWVTVGDERTRKSHKDRDGKKFLLSEGLYSSIDGKKLLTGTDYNCRCSTKFIIPKD